jgi:hypothetical protein
MASAACPTLCFIGQPAMCMDTEPAGRHLAALVGQAEMPHVPQHVNHVSAVAAVAIPAQMERRVERCAAGSSTRCAALQGWRVQPARATCSLAACPLPPARAHPWKAPQLSTTWRASMVSGPRPPLAIFSRSCRRSNRHVCKQALRSCSIRAEPPCSAVERQRCSLTAVIHLDHGGCAVQPAGAAVNRDVPAAGRAACVQCPSTRHAAAHAG